MIESITLMGSNAQRAVTSTKVGTKQALDVAITDASGNQIVSFGGASAIAEYNSPFDFTSVYGGTPSTITLSGLPITVTNATQIVYVEVITNGNTGTIYLNGQSGYTFRISGTTITAYKDGVVASLFAATDTISVGIDGQKKAYDLSTDTLKISNQTSDAYKYVQDSLVDTTNVAAATNYYPSVTGMSVSGYKDFSLTGYIAEADAGQTVVVYVEATNDENPVSTEDWVRIYGYDSKNNAVVNGLTFTGSVATSFALDFDDINYSTVRVVMVNSDATNTIRIKAKRKAL